MVPWPSSIRFRIDCRLATVRLILLRNASIFRQHPQSALSVVDLGYQLVCVRGGLVHVVIERVVFNQLAHRAFAGIDLIGNILQPAQSFHSPGCTASDRSSVFPACLYPG